MIQLNATLRIIHPITLCWSENCPPDWLLPNEIRIHSTHTLRLSHRSIDFSACKAKQKPVICEFEEKLIIEAMASCLN